MLRVRHQPLDGAGDLVAEDDRLVEREAPSPEQAPTMARLLAGPAGGGGRVGPAGSRLAAVEAQPDQPREHLARNARGPLLHALQDDLGEDDGRQVFTVALVHHPDFLPPPHHPGQVVEGHVAAGGGVVELAVLVAPDQPARGRRGRRLRLLHTANITQCVNAVKID